MKKYDLVFDIGANHGKFTEKVLQKDNNVKIIMIEPNNILVKKLKNIYGKNDQVEILDYLVSTNNNDYVDFYISNADTISTAKLEWITNSRFTPNYYWGQPIQKHTINIDELVNRYGIPDLLKIDVEGYEYEVIIGMTKKLKTICFEWAEEQYTDLNKICDYLLTLGYVDFGVLYNDDYLKEPDVYTTWEENRIHEDINQDRKEKWGMIWVK